MFLHLEADISIEVAAYLYVISSTQDMETVLLSKTISTDNYKGLRNSHDAVPGT